MQKQLILKISGGGETVEFKGLRIIAVVNKSILGGLNSADFSIYNVPKKLIGMLSKDYSDIFDINVSFSINNNGKIATIFNGKIFKGETVKNNADVVTKINCFDGLDAIKNVYTGNSNNKYTAYLKLCKEAGLTPQPVHFNNTLQKIAHSGQIFQQLKDLDKSRIFFIDNNTAHFIEKTKGITLGFSPVITKNQLISIPNKTNNKITFETLQNDFIKIGGMVLLSGLFGGALRVDSITINCDNFGAFCKQKVQCQYFD